MNAPRASHPSILGPWVAWVQHHASAVTWACVALTLVTGVYAARHLGVNSDNPRMMAPTMPARIHMDAFEEIFPTLEDALLVVVDAETPELARESAGRLADALRARPDLFPDVDLPGAGDFFERHGLLYQPLEDLEIFSEQIVAIQPLLASLEREPTLANLVSLIEEGLEATDDALDEPEEWSVVLDHFSEATVKVYAEYPVAVSWEDLTLAGSPVESQTRYTLIVQPVLDFESLFPAAKPMEEVRRIADELGLSPERGVRVRITGHPALNHEELVGVIWDVIAGVFLFFGLVLYVLYRALSSFRMVIASLVTLVSGLVWASAFAAFAVGDLSLPSLTFAIFFVGLGVDFTIHLGMAYASEVGAGHRAEPAMQAAIATVGRSFLMCTLTTSLGFLVFMPTENTAIAELGLISGAGMVLNLFASVTLYPALLAGWLRLEGKTAPPRRFHLTGRWRAVLEDNPRRVVAVSFALFALAVASSLRVRFDDNVLNIRDPATESVRTFEELVKEAGENSPWPINAVADDLDAADALADELERLEVVSRAVTLRDYVPEDQEEKLFILEDLGFLLDAAPAAPLDGDGAADEGPGRAEQIAALRAFRDYLVGVAPERADSSMGRSMRLLASRLTDFLERVDTHHDPERVAEDLATLESLLLSGVPDLFEQLRRATAVEPITLERLPDSLTRRMLAPDGRARVQIFPEHALSTPEAFRSFAREVTAVVPSASGVSVNLIALGHATRTSFQQAIAMALGLIAVLLYVLLWRRFTPVLLVLTPLVMASVATIGCMAALDLPLNLLNVLVIPLLLGVGVDSGIHLVHRAEHPVQAHEEILETTTARAVFFSALTTAMSFGTLALSSHRGIAGLGMALSFGMLFVVLCNLVVLPALLALRPPRS
jgi:hopanoid biosynthesis associated RND transporter like protein HpnN